MMAINHSRLQSALLEFVSLLLSAINSLDGVSQRKNHREPQRENQLEHQLENQLQNQWEGSGENLREN